MREKTAVKVFSCPISCSPASYQAIDHPETHASASTARAPSLSVDHNLKWSSPSPGAPNTRKSDVSNVGRVALK
jgi:hypothetical protein